MSKNYADYVWKSGIPHGINSHPTPKEITYKIISDPYHKRISVEKYRFSQFVEVVYDSALFDFRHLHPSMQTAWQKTPLSDKVQAISQIRNQDDRLIVIESYKFEHDCCRECKAVSPHGVHLSTQKMFYESLGDSFNGVVLYDANSHPVMSKRYAIDLEINDFGELLEEHWDMSRSPAFIS